MSTSKTNRRLEFKPISNEIHTGVFIKKDGFGFINKARLYVRNEHMNTALDKDLVEYRVVIAKDHLGNEKQEAQITNVIERYKTYFVGDVIYKEKGKTYVRLDNLKFRKTIEIAGEELSEGDKVMVRLTDFTVDQYKGEFVKIIGKNGEEDLTIKGILEEWNISDKFHPEVDNEIKDISLDIEGRRKDPGRIDLTDLPLVTIDPPDSKDFDDAIGVSYDKKHHLYTLHVAIADVWSYIKNHPETIKEAQNRSTSIYFLNSVIPMLPEKLCNDYCSLVPNAERCAIVMEINIDEKGIILWETVKLYPAIIKSKRRFTYREVNDFFEGTNGLKNEEKSVINLLTYGKDLYLLMEKKRIEKGYVRLENAELKLQMDRMGNVVSFQSYNRADAQFMIETFMITANEAVARYLSDRKIPGIYRTHEKPEINKIIAFITEANRVNFKIPPIYTTINQSLIYSWFETNKNHPLLDLVKIMLLKSLPKAVYSVSNSGHFGLNTENYLHFTSPIRRYPDVIVHKMLWEYVFEGKREELDDNEMHAKLREISKHCTEKEIEATEISRAIEYVKIVEYLNKNIDRVYKAKVVSMNKFGCYAKIDDVNIEGFVKTKQQLKLGSCILVKPIYNQKEFELIKIL